MRRWASPEADPPRANPSPPLPKGSARKSSSTFGATETPARDLAERLRDRLPRAWRREAVYELSGELIEAVWMFQDELGETDTPVQDLDCKHPGWREELPVRISDQVARTLLNDLLIEAVQVARRARIDVRWNVDLVPSPTGLGAARLVSPSATISEKVQSPLIAGHKARPPDASPSGFRHPRTFSALALGTERRTRRQWAEFPFGTVFRLPQSRDHWPDGFTATAGPHP